MESVQQKREDVLNRMRVFPYVRKYFLDNVTSNFVSNNPLLVNRFQPFTNASGPVNLGNNNAVNLMTRVGAMEFLEDYKFTGAYRINYGFQDNEVYARFDNLKRRLDWGLSYYRASSSYSTINIPVVNQISAIYQANISYPFNEVQSLRLIGGMRDDKYIIKSDPRVPATLSAPNFGETYLMGRIEFVHDNTINPATNIWNGLRYKVWTEMFNRTAGNIDNTGGDLTWNFGFDGRYYHKIYRNFIWAVRAAGDFSWGDNKLIYYLGGTDGWLMLGPNRVTNRQGVSRERYFNTANRPDPAADYVYESLAVNMRGFLQNSANGNNALVINSEFRLPVFATLFNKPINNAFLRNFQVVQFFDFGTAWNGKYDKIGRPSITYNESGSPLTVVIKAPGIGPFLGSYGFGARSTLLGYFVRFDAGWPMSGFFNSKPKLHVSLGFDF